MTKIIDTNIEKCTGCNKCIMVCPIKYANTVEIIDGERKVLVDKDSCIACGKCIEVCDHDSRTFLDDAERFWADLKNGKDITVMIAPSFVANQYPSYKKVLGFLKSKGVNLLFDVSLGADISSWGYVQYFRRGKKEDFIIAQPCPSIVDYIEKFTPNLLKHLAPNQSPVMCAAIYLKKYLKNTDKLALISPCIAKKIEIEKNTNERMIEYNITFQNLYSYIKKNDINLDDYEEIDYESTPSGLGMLFSKPGGLRENVAYHLPDLKIKQIEGTDKVYELLHYLSDGHRIEGYDLFDLLNCSSGCNIGPAACQDNNFDDNMSEIAEEFLHSKRIANQNKRTINYEEYDKLFRYFDENFDYRDFLIGYENQSDKINVSLPNEEELDSAFNRLKKHTTEERKRNCYSCGYKYCKDMAIAIHNGYNIPASCYVFNQKELEFQKNNLEENENYIRTILQHLTESVIVTDEAGIIEFVNKESEHLFCENAKNFKNKNISDYITGLKISELTETTCYEFQVDNCQDTTSTIKLEYSNIELNDKKLLIFIIMDITREKELDTLKDNFISVVSHELRTPLTSIRGALGLVSSGVLGDLSPKAKELISIAGNNSVRLVSLINDILDIQKIKAGKMEFDFEIHDVMSLVNETVLSNREYAKQYNVEYKIIKEENKTAIKTDKNRFHQVLSNLLSNAAKFSNTDELVEIEVTKTDKHVRISVNNKGKGIPEKSRNRIFEGFYQVDSSDSRQKGGTGLGLNICKNIIEKMNGKIDFHSVENEITTFYFELPISTPTT